MIPRVQDVTRCAQVTRDKVAPGFFATTTTRNGGILSHRRSLAGLGFGNARLRMQTGIQRQMNVGATLMLEATCNEASEDELMMHRALCIEDGHAVGRNLIDSH